MYSWTAEHRLTFMPTPFFKLLVRFMTFFASDNTKHRNYTVGLFLFWLGAFILNAGPHWEIYSSTREMVETAGMKTGLQLFVAFITLKFLVPNFMEKGQWLIFSLTLFGVIIVASEISIVIRYCYLEQRYPESYKRFLSMYGNKDLLERMDLTWALRYILFTKLPQLTFPTVLIAAYHFFQKQQTLLKLKEQKISAELDALKNQLNPHFIFNTLNNIYALSLKKSDQTPIAIETLSAILDYVVYRCNDKFVDLGAEINLIENYVTLEKIRYGNRLNFNLTEDIQSNIKIAPLILLTLVENACKHGVREELNQAQVSMSLTETGNQLHITVRNSKPKQVTQPGVKDKQIGLSNLKKQLDLLYPQSHTFSISDEPENYTANLMLLITP